MKMIVNGLDIWLENIDPKKYPAYAMVANQTSLTSDWEYSWDVLRRKGCSPGIIFSPEHGLFATEQDQVAVDWQPGFHTKLVSLYGNNQGSLVPRKELLQDIEKIVFDIQDIGTRYYTYANTMALIMDELHGTGIEMVILDRPNPLGGLIVEGPMLEESYSSFVGVFNVPVRHGLTAGELAYLYRDVQGLDVDLTVVKCTGWERHMSFPSYADSWIPQSPNMPTFHTALLYPGMCLLEGTNLSEGRGTASPFHLSGAPCVDPFELASHISRVSQLTDFVYRPVYFKPWANKYHGEIAGGVYVQVINGSTDQSFLSGLALIKGCADLYGESFEFLHGVYEFNSLYPAFDLLCGGSGIREMILRGDTLAVIGDYVKDVHRQFKNDKSRLHLYD